MVCPADGRSHTIKAAAISRLKTRITAWSVDEAGNIGTLKTPDRNDAPSFLEFGVGNYSPMPAQELTVSPSGTAGTAASVAVPATSSGPIGTCSETVPADEDAMAFQDQAPALLLDGGYGTTAAAAADPASSFTVSGWFYPTSVSAGTMQPVITQIDGAGHGQNGHVKNPLFQV